MFGVLNELGILECKESKEKRLEMKEAIAAKECKEPLKGLIVAGVVEVVMSGFISVRLLLI